MAHSDDDAPAAALQRHITELEIELAITLGELRRIRASAAPFEQRAMAALRDCDVAGARAALCERDVYLSDIGVLEADARVLRALLAECDDFLSRRAGRLRRAE